ncbi:MAG: PAS domain-containing protein [Deltaproteobacteria bacterium]|nr:PAS domain-containing protein [Deltaproteobacteria bacterium]
MRMGARAKLFLVLLGLLLVSMAAAEIYLLPTIERDLTERIREDLHVRLRLVAERAGSALAENEPAWDALADRLGTIARARVTFIREDGAVLGDSEVEARALATLENHRTRPEIVAAFAGQTGDSIRYSATIQQRMMYSATPIPGTHTKVTRLSLPLVWVEGAKSRVRMLLLGGALVALAAAIVFSFAAAVLMSRGLRKLTAIARRMAVGDLDVRSRSESPDEIGELGRTLDHLAANLSRSLRELREDRDLLGRILESMREGVLVMDGEHRILLANPSLREMLLLDSEVVGRSTIEVIRNAELQAMVEKALASSEPATGEIEVGGLKPRRLLVHAAPLSGEPRALVLVLFDVTETRRLETVRRDFVANVSHELRTPVAAVRSAAETLRMAVVQDPRAATQFIDIIERNGRRLGGLIDDLLDLSRIEAREFRLSVQSLDVAGLAEKTLAAFADRASSRQMHMSVQVPADLPRAAGDANAVDRVLANLIDNALKYCPDGAGIIIKARLLGKKIQVLVSDTGTGIDAKHLPRLFERFYRIDKGRSRDMGGTGLGLSIVKHLVEAMGGEVSVESVPGQGSTFAFTLPRAG